jgi:hypothetical protein
MAPQPGAGMMPRNINRQMGSGMGEGDMVGGNITMMIMLK